MSTVRQEVVQGDTWAFEVGWYDPLPSGQPDFDNPVDLTGYTARCQVRSNYGVDPAITLTSDPAAGLTVGGVSGVVSGLVADTSELAVKTWLWEVEIFNASTDFRKTLNPSSKLVIKAQVTDD